MKTTINTHYVSVATNNKPDFKKYFNKEYFNN